MSAENTHGKDQAMEESFHSYIAEVLGAERDTTFRESVETSLRRLVTVLRASPMQKLSVLDEYQKLIASASYTWKPIAETASVSIPAQFQGYPRGSDTGRVTESGTREALDELRLQNERLKSLAAQERRSAARMSQKYDQLLMEHSALRETMDKLVQLLKERAEANDALQATLLHHEEGRLRMFESHEGIVMDVDDDCAVVTYSIDDEYVDQTYRREQFVDGTLPKKGERLALFVHVAEVLKRREDEPTSGAATDEQPRHRKRAIRPPREF